MLHAESMAVLIDPCTSSNHILQSCITAVLSSAPSMWEVSCLSYHAHKSVCILLVSSLFERKMKSTPFICYLRFKLLFVLYNIRSSDIAQKDTVLGMLISISDVKGSQLGKVGQSLKGRFLTNWMGVRYGVCGRE